MFRDEDTPTLEKIFRASPPDQPARFYKLTREGRWLRRSSSLGFREVKNPIAPGRIRFVDHTGTWRTVRLPWRPTTTD